MIDFHGLDDGTVPRLYENSYGEGPLGVVRTIKSADALYYYYKPEYLDFVADEVSGLFTKSHTVIFRSNNMRVIWKRGPQVRFEQFNLMPSIITTSLSIWILLQMRLVTYLPRAIGLV